MFRQMYKYSVLSRPSYVDSAIVTSDNAGSSIGVTHTVMLHCSYLTLSAREVRTSNRVLECNRSGSNFSVRLMLAVLLLTSGRMSAKHKELGVVHEHCARLSGLHTQSAT